MTRHADHAAKIIAAARIRSRESGRRGGKDDHLADCRDGQAGNDQGTPSQRIPIVNREPQPTTAATQPVPRPNALPAESERMPYRRIANGRPSIPPCYARLAPQMVRARLQHVLADTGALIRDGACSITPVAGKAPIGGRSRSRGPPARRRSDEPRGGGGAQFAGTAAVGAAEKRGPQFPGMCRVCSRPGRPDYAVLVSGTEPADG